MSDKKKNDIPDDHFEHDLNLPDHVPLSDESQNWQDNLVEQLKRKQKTNRD